MQDQVRVEVRVEVGGQSDVVSGESDLSVLLAGMAAELLPGRYVFTTMPPTVPTALSGSAQVDPGLEVLASVLEPEGLSLVVRQEQADRAGLAYDFVAGWITLRVHSALHAVGLTASVSTALAAAGISCNVVAGYHHDHLLVPVDRAHDALAVLQELSRRQGGGAAGSGR